MEKIMKKCVVVSMIIIIIFGTTSCVTAQITESEVIEENVIENENGDKVSGISYILEGGASLIMQPLVKAFTALLQFFVYIIMSVVGLLFSLSGMGQNSAIYFPMPHHLVFNLIPFFDPNFINPAIAPAGNMDNVIQIVSKVISPLYYTGVMMVGGLFTIIALIIGIKLAISVSAQEKAQYKSAISVWITGIVMLFAGHLLMAAVFGVNEQIVSNLYEASKKEEIQVAVWLPKDKSFIEKLEAWVAGAAVGTATSILLGPIFGVPLGAAIIADGVAAVDYDEKVFTGFEGLFSMYLQRMLNGEAIATIIVAILMGQIVALIILYVKRLFYCVILGMLLPFVIGIDTLKKVMGQKSGLFEKWFIQFGIAVFMQSIHAFIMFFTLILINQLQKVSGQEILNTFGPDKVKSLEAERVVALISLVEMGMIASLTRIEAVIKDYIGLPDAKAGNLQTAGSIGFAGFRMATGASRNIVDNFTGMKAGRTSVKKLRNQVDTRRARDEMAKNEEIENPIKPILPAPLPSTAQMDPTRSKGPGPMLGDGKLDINDLAQIGGVIGTDNQGLNRIQNSLDRIIHELQAHNTNTSNNTKAIESTNSAERLNRQPAPAPVAEKSLQEMERELRTEEKKLAGKTLAALMSPAVVVGSLAVGAGATSNIKDVTAIASALISSGDHIAEKIGENVNRPTQLAMIKPQINYEEYLQQKITKEFSLEKTRENSKGRTTKQTINNKRNDDFTAADL